MPTIRHLEPTDPGRRDLWGHEYPASVVFCAQCGDDYTCLHDPLERPSREKLRDTTRWAAEERGWRKIDGLWRCPTCVES